MFKDNPVLRGKDAERFLQRMKEANEGKHRVSKEEWERSKKIYDFLMNKARKKTETLAKEYCKCSCSPTAEATVSNAAK